MELVLERLHTCYGEARRPGRLGYLRFRRVHDMATHPMTIICLGMAFYMIASGLWPTLRRRRRLRGARQRAVLGSLCSDERVVDTGIMDSARSLDHLSHGRAQEI